MPQDTSSSTTLSKNYAKLKINIKGKDFQKEYFLKNKSRKKYCCIQNIQFLAKNILISMHKINL